MTENTYTAGEMPFDAWQKEHKDTTHLILRGCADENTVIDIESFLRHSDLQLVSLDNFRAADFATDEGASYPYLDTWKERARHSLVPLMIIIKLMLNQHRCHTFRQEKELFLSQDGTLLVHYPFKSRCVLPDAVTAIGDFAFCGYHWLRSILFNETLHQVGECACYGCPKLHYVDLPDAVTAVGSRAFACGRIYNVRLPANLSVIPAACFAASALNFVELPAGVRSIESAAFEGLQQASLTIPEGVVRIGSRAFANAKTKRFLLPASLQYLDPDFCDNILIADGHPTPFVEVAEGNGRYFSDAGIVKASATGQPVVKTASC